MELTLTLNPQSDRPLYQQVYEELRQAILTGRLLPRQRVPSTRSLAHSLGISRTTVTQSYEQLLSEGYLETRRGAGTFVCSQLPDNWLQTEQIAPLPAPKSPSIRLSHYAQHLLQQSWIPQPEPSVDINFRYGCPAFSHFPIARWRQLLLRHCPSAPDPAQLQWLNYAADPQGYYPLREAIARYLSRARAVQCHPEQIVITNGTQQALDLILRVLLEPGETIALEDPGYLSARKIFLSHGANLLPIPVDNSGLRVDRLVHYSAASIRLVYVTPSHQFPTGATLSLPRRFELLSWAQQQGALILEDDYDSEYRYRETSHQENRPIPALQGLDNHQVVLYIGTFSKVLFPGLRIGYVVLPFPLVSVITQAKWLSDRQLPVLEQQVLTDFIEEGYLENHIRKMRAYYDRIRQALVQALHTYFGTSVTILGDNAGLHIMVRFKLSLTNAEIIQRAKTAGVGLTVAAPHYLTSNHQGEFILGYGELNEPVVWEGIRRLAAVL